MFSLLTVDQSTVEAQTAISNLYHVYLARDEGRAIVASKAQMAKAALENTNTPIPSHLHLGSLVACRWLAHDRTAYAGVEMVPGFSRAVIDDEGVKLESLGSLSYDGHGGEIRSPVAEEIGHELLESVAATCSTAGGTPFGITGGRDSRLLLSAAYRLGAVERCFTTGAPDHPDVVIGQQVAARLGLRHEIRNPLSSRLPDLTQLRSAAARALLENDLVRDSWSPAFSGRGSGASWNGYGGSFSEVVI